MPFIDFFAGCCGGAAGVLVGHPLDTIKVRLQTQTSPVNMSDLYNKKQRFGGLYNGLSSPLACLTFVNAIVFGVYGHINEHLKKKNTTNQEENIYGKMRREFIAGMLSGAAQCTIACPMELIKCRMQVQSTALLNGTSLTIDQTIRTIHRQDGLKAFYRGFIPTLLRDAPAFGIYFSSFEFLIDRHNEIPSEGSFLIAGGIAGIFSWVFTYPIDVIKTKIQTDGGKCDYSLLKCCKLMFLENHRNWKIFFRGITPTLLRAFPVNAVTFLIVQKTFEINENWSSSKLVTQNN